MSGGLEATLTINAKDNAGAAFAALQKTIGALEKQIETIDKMMTTAGRVTKSTDPLAASIASTQRALAEQREALSAASQGLDRFEGAGSGAASAQGRLRSAIERTTSVLVAQGAEASRVAARISESQRRASSPPHGGSGGRVGEILPFAGPEILHETEKAAVAGGTVQEEIARLLAAGATPDQISKARADFVDFSKTHSGVLESDYLAGYRDARVIAPGEAPEMTRLGATYRVALRNSGISSTEADVGNVLRIMDELGFKKNDEREDFLDHFLKAQQAFGSQISTETALSAYRNAKQSIYNWSPDFRDKFFPTLLQSSGQQGGTEMMTALNNYIGQHMQLSELKALIGAGFVNNSDLTFDHNKPGLKPGAHLFEADTFKSNIARWAWDFHDHFMGRKDATEGKFDDLIAKMPRNMAALIAFLVHNESRIKRDAGTLDLPVGLAAAGDTALAKNAAAGLEALKTSIEQFAATVTAPAMDTIGAKLASMAHGLQLVSAAYHDFADKNPTAGNAIGIGALAGGAAAGGWLSWKLFTGIGKILGFGGAEAATGAASAAATGVTGRLAGTAFGGAVGELLWPILALREIGEALNPTTPQGQAYRNDLGWPTQREDMERSRRSRLVFHPGGWTEDPEAAHGRAMHTLMEHGSGAGDIRVSLDPNSKAEIAVRVEVAPTGELLRAVADARGNASGNLKLNVGASRAGVAPNGRATGGDV